jgi:glycosyltransferase involved in cell wall biosynthesis
MVEHFSEIEFLLFSDEPLDAFTGQDNVKVIQVTQSRPVSDAATANDHRGVLDTLRFTRAVARESMDVMFFPAVYSWFPVKPSQPVVVTFHDAIAEHFPELVMPHWPGRFLWNLKVKLAKMQAKRFLTVSRAARDEIVEHLRIPVNLVDLTTEGPHHRFRPDTDAERLRAVRDAVGLPAECPYLIYVGGFAPHKNLAGFLRAFARVLASEPGNSMHVALVGDPGGAGFHSNTRELEELLAENSALQERVVFTGFVDDNDLVTLYSGAYAGIMPSFSEGFGLPAIEAMACGTPVLASNVGSLPEVVGEAGLLFDPWSADDMASCISRISNDESLRSELASRSLARSAEFSWKRASELAIQCLNRAIEER